MLPRLTYHEFMPESKLRLAIVPFRHEEPRLPMHVHEFSELVIVIEGRGWHQIGEEEYPTGVGDVCLIHKNVSHGFRDASGLKVCNILFDPRQTLHHRQDLRKIPGYHALFHIEPLYRSRHRFGGKLTLSAAQQHFVFSLIHMLEREQQVRAPGHESMMLAHFLHLVIYLARVYDENHAPAPQDLMRLSNVLSHIQTHFRRPLRLGELARIAHLSPNQFLRIFRKCYQTTPNEYILGLRLECARELLRFSDKTIAEVAYASGFSGSNYLARQFRKAYGLTPGEFRRAGI